jgi:hypothetical protein
MPTKTKPLYEKAVHVSEEYLGPAGERFLRRQITTHLGIKPESLTTKHIPKLVTWVGLTFAMLTDNPNDVDNFVEALLSLKA